jgi:hypothetical protein
MTTILDPRDRLASVPNHLRLAHARASALRAYAAELQAPVLIATEGGGIGDTVTPSNNLSALVALSRSQPVTDLLAAERLLALIEDSADYKEAVVVVEPLLALAAQDVAEIEEAERKEREALAALNDAEQTARVKLEGKIAADPAVVKAKANLAGIKRLGQPLDPEPEGIARELAADHH